MPLIPIALAYRPSTAATTVCLLEAAGFDVVCPNFHTMTLLPHWALAMGGAPLCVPRDQAADALALLWACHSAGPGKPSFATGRLVQAVAFLGFGVSMPWPDLALAPAPMAQA